MSTIDVKQLLSEEMNRRSDDRMAAAAAMVEQAIEQTLKQVVPAEADKLEGMPHQPQVVNGAGPDSSVPSPPQPSSSSSEQSSKSAHVQGLVKLAVQELARYRLGSDEQINAIQEKSLHLSNLTGVDQQEVAAELANQLAQQPQPQADDSTSTGSDQSGLKSKLKNAFRSDDQG